MPSTSTPSKLSERVTTQRNLTIFTAVLVAIPAAYGFQWAFSGTDLGGSFLLLTTLAVGVPTAYEEHWPKYDRAQAAITWVLAACVVAAIEFTGLYLLGTDILELSPLFASVGAFLVVDLGNLVWLSARKRPQNSGR